MTASVAGASITFPSITLTEKGLESKNLQAVNPEVFKGGPATRFLQEVTGTRAEDSSIPSCVQVETLLDEDFDLWVKGTNEIPDSQQVDEDAIQDFLKYPGDWIFFDVYEAGKAAYLGFDEVGDNGPGYISTPVFSVAGANIAYRLKVKAMNVNANSQTQGLQVFFLDESTSMMVGASTRPLLYEEWSICEWVGQSSTEKLRAMMYGWQGKVLIDQVTLEKLVYPLDTPKVLSLEMLDLDQVKVNWTSVADASSYKVDIYKSYSASEQEYLSSVTVEGESGVVTLPENIEAEISYIAYVTALNGENESYPGAKGSTLSPNFVATSVALPATEVSQEGFTANWEKTSNAATYMVFPAVNHTNVDGTETFFLLEDDFQQIPETNDSYNPQIVCPLLGYDVSMDRYMAVKGWSTDICMFARLIPEMPSVILTNQYALYGLPGYIMSPKYDLSVGGGNVTVSGLGMSAAGDVILTIGLVDETGEIYSYEEAEVSPMGDMFEVTIANGQENSSIMIWISDAEDEDMVLIPSLYISVDLENGESIEAALPTVFVDSPATSYKFDYPVNADNTYSYSVSGFFGDKYGDESNVIVVDAASSAVKDVVESLVSVSTNGGVLTVNNPENLDVTVYGIDGLVLASSSDNQITVEGYKGIVVVKAGEKTFKVAL